MDAQRKKTLQEEYKHRTPEMGVLALTCTATGEVFLQTTTDLPAEINSLRVKLNSYHPNKQLKALWEQYGEEGFVFSVMKEYTYKDPTANHKAELEKLRDACLAADEKAKKVWR